MNSEEQQLSVRKGKPRGRPFLPGVSGNPQGRPSGARHKTTLAVLEGIRRAEEQLNRPLMLDKSLPFEVWSDCYVQFGRRYRKDNLLEKNPGGPPPVQPEMLDPRKARQEMVWQGRRLYLQFGWPFDPATWKAVKL